MKTRVKEKRKTIYIDARCCHLVQDDSKDNDDQDNGQDKQQNARLAPSTLLVVASLLKVYMRASRRIVRRLNILLDDIELGPLLMHHVSDITKQLVELADRLLDIADLGLALDDEGFLEVDLVLVREA